MAVRWFYARGEDKAGPYSGQQLKDLADSGDILPTDTVWKEGVAKGSLAAKVQHLFAASPPILVIPILAAPALEAELLLPRMADAQLVPEVPVAPVPAARDARQPQARKAMAFAGRGTVIVGQDGVNVRYKKKCTVCQHTESYSHTMPIREGTTSASFFCPKCLKNRPVQIRGSLS